VTPAPLLAAERIALLIAEDRVKRAAILGVLFLVFGVAGIGMNLGGRADGWYPFLGVPFVMAGAVAFVWWRTRCPRCGRRVLMGRRRLPGVCPACGARLVAAKAPRDASDDVSTG
jgi:peptidoglycan/LPS O-acetylase OafA/YrhL